MCKNVNMGVEAGCDIDLLIAGYRSEITGRTADRD